ncbi:hypothetical protein [Alienimonas californiensis]|uniref:Uncharacterized protein n=1 Tax=Alienimonas californiensis TaxID=2527989 RepID=A0A517P9N5_9PLAN|nr:hypothetical protein [Alienimonas californiensis]QDT16086.1 hypothetical protein CA12_21840 [Alienimonas californiensis]
MPHRTAARRPLPVCALPLRDRDANCRTGGPRTVRLLTLRAARRAALPLALVLSAGAVGCQSASRPLEALAGVRDAAFHPNRPCEGPGCGPDAVATAPDPFAAAERAVAQQESADESRVVADAGAAPHTPDSAKQSDAQAGAKFADEFDAMLAVLRDEATPFPSSDPADRLDSAAGDVSLAGANDDMTAAGEDPSAQVEALSKAAPKADLASAPTGPGDLFSDAPVGPRDLFAGAHAEPSERPTSLDQAFADTAAPASVETTAGAVGPTDAVRNAAVQNAAAEQTDLANADSAAETAAADDSDLVPPPWGPAAVAALAADDPGDGFDPFAQSDLTAQAQRTAQAAKAAHDARAAATTSDAAAALAAPMPSPLPASNPFGRPPAAPSAGATVSANVGTLPSAEADVAAAPRPVPVEALGPLPELSFGRPPLPPSFTGDEESFAPPAASRMGSADPSLAALAGPDAGLPEGEPRIAFGQQEPAFGPPETVPATDLEPALAALAAPAPVPMTDAAVNAAEKGNGGRFAPTMPTSDAAAPALVAGEERLPDLRTAARPTARGEARLAGAVELDAPAMHPAGGVRTASPAAPLAAGLGVGCVLLVGLSLWRRRGGLL